MLRSIFFAALLCSVAFADTLVLKNGNKVDGTFLGGDSRNIRMTVGDRIQSFSISDVVSIQFGTTSTTTSTASPDAGQQSTITPAPASVQPAPALAADSGLRTRESAPAGTVTGMEIPAGTSFVVRMIDAVDSETDKVGQTFRASLDEPLMINGEVVIPRGSDVLLKLVDQKQSGRIQGQTSLTLDVVSMTVNGRVIDVNTEEITQASSSRGARSGKVIGGTAAVGAIIGAIAGGGKGAAIGGLAGAGAGTAAEVMTSGQRVKIPSETRLTFALEQPIRI